MRQGLDLDQGLLIGDPDYTIPHHGEARGLPHVEIEIRQDLVSDEAGRAQWAQRITSALQDAEQVFRAGAQLSAQSVTG